MEKVSAEERKELVAEVKKALSAAIDKFERRYPRLSATAIVSLDLARAYVNEEKAFMDYYAASGEGEKKEARSFIIPNDELKKWCDNPMKWVSRWLEYMKDYICDIPKRLSVTEESVKQAFVSFDEEKGIEERKIQEAEMKPNPSDSNFKCVDIAEVAERMFDYVENFCGTPGFEISEMFEKNRYRICELVCDEEKTWCLTISVAKTLVDEPTLTLSVDDDMCGYFKTIEYSKEVLEGVIADTVKMAYDEWQHPKYVDCPEIEFE